MRVNAEETVAASIRRAGNDAKGGRAASDRCEHCGKRCSARERVRLEEYDSPQLTLIFAELRNRDGRITPNSVICRSCLEEVERELQRRQIVSLQGESFFVDLSLGTAPILPTPHRMNASARYTGRGVTIAFVDSGFAPHPDLILPVNRVLGVYDAVNDREIFDFERAFSDEPPIEAWHGTMAASVAAGSGHLSGGRYRGIASDAQMVLIKTMTPERYIRTPQVKRALEWIRDNHRRFNIRVVNLSLGVDETTRSMKHPVIALIEELTARGVVVVAASGNNPTRPLVPPGSAPSAITVGGYNDNNSLDWRERGLWHSSYGRTPNGVRKPELLGPAIWVAAPILLRTGVKAEAEALFYMAGADDETLRRSIPILARETGIAEALLSSRSMLQARAHVLERMRREKLIGPSYKHVDGTSFAAPIVASIAAQLLEIDPDLTPAQVRERLTRTARRIPEIAADAQGYGLVRADRAVERTLEKRSKSGPGGMRSAGKR